MKLRSSLALILLLFAGMISAHAQVGSAVVTAAASYTTNVGDTVTVRAQLQSCGQGANPIYQGSPISLTPNQTPAAPFTATNTGFAQSITFTVPGNDQIICGGQAYSLYGLTWYDNGFPLGPTTVYRFLDATAQTLANLVPVGFTPPVLQNATGSYCPAATPVFSGFTSTYQILCGTTGTAAAMPLTGGTFTGAVIFSSTATYNSTTAFNALATFNSGLASKYINGIPQADQFPGADMCAKVNAAILYALANHFPIVDATHFSGLQTCTSGVNPFSMTSAISDYTPANLDVKFGSVVIASSAMFEVKNSALTIEGVGPTQTIFWYNGTGTPAAAFYAHAQTSAVTNGIEQVHLKNFFVLGGNNTNNHALYLQDVNRSSVEDVAAWGATTASGSGMEFQGNVTTSLTRIKASGREYAMIANLISGTHSTPYVGINLNSSTASGNQCTDSTVTDFAAEYITGGASAGIGLLLTSANSMTITSGTSEANKAGIQVNSSSNYNTFIDTDEEGNSVFDVQEGGRSDVWIGTIASVASFSSTANWDVWDGGNVQVGNFTNNAPSSQGNRIINEGNLYETPLVWANNLAGTPTNMPFSGTSHLWGGIGGMNATGSGGELDLFSAFVGAAYDACFYHNVTTSGYAGDVCLGPTNQFNTPAIFASTLSTSGVVNIQSDLKLQFGVGSLTFTPGTGVTSAACVSGHTCSNVRGVIQIVNSSATTAQTLVTVHWSTTLAAAPECVLSQQSGATFYGLGGTATTTTFPITNTNTVSGSGTIFVAYVCAE